MFKGSLVALITPFRDHELDESAFQEHVAWQINQGTHGLVPCGTTGESPALADEEQKRLVSLCVEVAKGKQVPVIAGTGTNSTEHTIVLTQQAKAAGADAALIVCPYYNKPTQEGLYHHFKAVHDAVELPIIIYNIPGRSSVDMTNATMARLAQLPNIVGVKDATNDLARPLRMRVDIGAGFCLLSGEDATAADWVGAYVNLSHLSSDRADFTRFWTEDVELQRMHRIWLRWAVNLIQCESKITTGNPADEQHSTYFLDCDVFLTADKRYVDNGKIVLSAGISAGIDMSLHVVARLLGWEEAVATAHYMEYAWRPEV